MEPFQYAAGESKPGLYYLRPWMDRFPGLTAGLTSRCGGVSGGPFASLNVGLHVEDNSSDVVANRLKAAEEIGVPLHNWVYGEQVHGTRVTVVTEAERGRGTQSRTDELPQTDAFITDREGLCLAALFADCVPLFFFDPDHKAIGVAHAGWRGTVGRIACRVVERMKDEFETGPERLFAAIGPSIGSCCYEVDERVADQVRELFPWLEGGSDFEKRCLLAQKTEGKYRLDLQLINRQIMIKAGILPSRIELTKWCTSCRSDQFYSHRKEHGRTGRMSAWIGWQ